MKESLLQISKKNNDKLFKTVLPKQQTQLNYIL